MRLAKQFYPKTRMRILTPRQKQLAELVSQGLSNKGIAVELQLTEGGVKEALKRIYTKLGMSGKHNPRLTLMLRQLPPSSQELPACETCVFRGFAKWIQAVSGQLENSMKTLIFLLLSVVATSAQTITFAPQPFSRIPGLSEYRVYISSSDGKPVQVPGVQVILSAQHQSIRLYSYVNLQAYVDDLNKRSKLRWAGIGLEAAGWVLTSGQAVQAIKIKERWAQAGIAGLAGVLTLSRTFYDREYKPIALPSDLMQPLIAVPPGGSVEFSVFTP